MAIVQTEFDSVDMRLVESYKHDSVARSLRQLATSLVGSTVYVDVCGYIIHDGKVYVPFIEAKRVFQELYIELYEEDPSISYVDIVFYFEEMFYSPEVTAKDMRRWYEACQDVK